MKASRWAPCALIAVAVAGVNGCGSVELLQLSMANRSSPVRFDATLPASIPFREHDGWVVIQASVNGKEPIDFVLDTGAAIVSMLDDHRSAYLGFDMSGVHRLGWSESLTAPLAAPQEDIVVDLGPVAIEDMTMLAIPTRSLLCKEGMPLPPFSGVLGHELFSRFVVRFDYDRNEVVLYDKDSYRYEGDGTIVELDIEGRQPYVTALVHPPAGASYPAKLHLDTGANQDVSLFPVSDPAIVPPQGGKRSSSCFVGGEATYHSGTAVALQFGERTDEVPAVYALDRSTSSAGENGRLGTRYLSRYNVIFDYERSRMILEPRAESRTETAS